MAPGQGARQSARAVRPPAGRGESRPPAVDLGARRFGGRGARGPAAPAGTAGGVPGAPSGRVHDHRHWTAGGPRLRARRRRRVLRAVRLPVVRRPRARPDRAGSAARGGYRDLAESAPGLPAARGGHSDRQRPAVRPLVPALSSRARRHAAGAGRRGARLRADGGMGGAVRGNRRGPGPRGGHRQPEVRRGRRPAGILARLRSGRRPACGVRVRAVTAGADCREHVAGRRGACAARVRPRAADGAGRAAGDCTAPSRTVRRRAGDRPRAQGIGCGCGARWRPEATLAPTW